MARQGMARAGGWSMEFFFLEEEGILEVKNIFQTRTLRGVPFTIFGVPLEFPVVILDESWTSFQLVGPCTASEK